MGYFNTIPEIVRDLVSAYCDYCKFVDTVGEQGGQLARCIDYMGDLTYHTALDLIGFPKESEDINRDSLFDSSLISKDSTNRHQTVDELLEYLYACLKEWQTEYPHLFESK